jgi:hypothetical protein
VCIFKGKPIGKFVQCNESHGPNRVDKIDRVLVAVGEIRFSFCLSIIMAPTEETMASRPSAISDSNAIISPTSPTSPQSMVLPTDMGWKITIKNTDGTSNEVTLEPKAPVHTNTMREMPFGEVADPEKVQGSIEKKPATVSSASCNT